MAAADLECIDVATLGRHLVRPGREINHASARRRRGIDRILDRHRGIGRSRRIGTVSGHDVKDRRGNGRHGNFAAMVTCVGEVLHEVPVRIRESGSPVGRVEG